MMILKKLAVVLSLAIAGCASTAPMKPVAPPPVAPVAVAPKAPKPVLHTFIMSDTMRQFKGPTWSVSMPDNMDVAKQDKDGLVVKGLDSSYLVFERAASKDDLDTVAGQVVYAMAMRGHNADRMVDLTVDNHPAKMVLFLGSKVMVWTIVATPKVGYAYSIVYIGRDGMDRVRSYKAVLKSVHLANKPMHHMYRHAHRHAHKHTK